MTDPTPIPELTPDGDPSILDIPMPPAPPGYQLVVNETVLVDPPKEAEAK